MEKWIIAGLIVVCFTQGVFARQPFIETSDDMATNILLGAVREGSRSNKASGVFSHAEGYNTEASGYASHAEGSGTKAQGYYSHAEGQASVAGGHASHAAGAAAWATNDYAYVWSDGTVTGSTTSKQFTVHAANGIRLLGGPITGNGSGLTNLNMEAYAGNNLTWTNGQLRAQPGYSDADAVAAVRAEYPNLGEVLNASEVISIISSNGFVTATQMTGLTAADVGAYTTEEANQAISKALSGIQMSGYVATNHVGDVSINGVVTLQANLSVQGTATFEGLIYIPRQGDLDMGVYTNRP